MVDKQDWAAVMSSEVFRNYVDIQLQKEAAEKKTPEQIIEREVEELDAALSSLDKFEEQVKNSVKLLETFKRAKATLIAHPELMDKVDKRFIDGIMMLDLEEE